MTTILNLHLLTAFSHTKTPNHYNYDYYFKYLYGHINIYT